MPVVVLTRLLPDDGNNRGFLNSRKCLIIIWVRKDRKMKEEIFTCFIIAFRPYENIKLALFSNASARSLFFSVKRNRTFLRVKLL